MCLGIQETTDGREREREGMKVKKIKRRRKRSREEKRRTKHTHKDSEILERRRRGRKKHEERIFPLFLTKNTRKYTQIQTHALQMKGRMKSRRRPLNPKGNQYRERSGLRLKWFLLVLTLSFHRNEGERERERVMFGQNLQSAPGENSNSLLLLCIWCCSLRLPHVVAIYPSTHSHSSRSSSVLSLSFSLSPATEAVSGSSVLSQFLPE